MKYFTHRRLHALGQHSDLSCIGKYQKCKTFCIVHDHSHSDNNFCGEDAIDVSGVLIEEMML